ncbi:MAG: penicillin-binding protein [Geobacteraceae bacterium]|nr:penicillin-binding protein [Geobacteraceae bacterium]
MQDLKNLSRQNRRIGFSFFSFGRSNRKTTRSGERPFPRLYLPGGKHRVFLKRLLVAAAIVLTLIPLSQFAARKYSSLAGEIRSWMIQRRSAAHQAEPAEKVPVSSFVTACLLLDDASGPPDQLTARTLEGELLHYTIRGDLQKRVHDFLAKNQVPYGVFVAIEPSTGRILAMTAHSSVEPGWSKNASFNLYPMASLFKIITASAALESRRITPETVIEFRGNATSENPRYWEASPKKSRNNRTDVTYAMGKSINPVYGRLACDIAGKASVMECVDRFGFNQPLLPGTSAKESTAAEPQSSHGLMLMGAGLDHEVKISPLHAAVMMAAIANGGRMMAPGLTDRITDRKGKEKETFAPHEIRRLVAPETAASLTRMLSSTVTTGTSRRAFHDRRGRPRLDVEIAAKTGSINGSDPRGQYSWFAAYAPAHNPRIALVALIINQDKWRIKSAQVGEQALEEFFGN